MAQLEGILGTREYSTHSHIFGIIDRFFTTHEMTILCHDLPFNQLDDRNVLSLCSKHLSSSVAIRIQYSISSSYCTNRTARCVSACVDHECLCPQHFTRLACFRKVLGIWNVYWFCAAPRSHYLAG